MKTDIKTIAFSTIFVLLSFYGNAHAVVSSDISKKKNNVLFKLNSPLSKSSKTEITSKKITDKITLKLNRDLFEKGLEVKTKGYGQYFANLESSNHLEIKFKKTLANALRRKMRQSSLSAAMRFGGYVSEKSKVYLKIGFESENFGTANTLKTRTTTNSNQGYWKTAMSSGVGFQYDFSKKWSFLGVASTMAISLPIDQKTAIKTPENEKSKKRKLKSRNNRLLIGLRYRFGE